MQMWSAIFDGGGKIFVWADNMWEAMHKARSLHIERIDPIHALPFVGSRDYC